MLSNGQKNRVTVDIYGQKYTIVGPESKSHIRHVAEMVDQKMRETSTANPTLDIHKLAVLTAVNAMNDYIKLMEQYELLEIEYKKLKD